MATKRTLETDITPNQCFELAKSVGQSLGWKLKQADQKRLRLRWDKWRGWILAPMKMEVEVSQFTDKKTNGVRTTIFCKCSNVGIGLGLLDTSESEALDQFLPQLRAALQIAAQRIA